MRRIKKAITILLMSSFVLTGTASTKNIKSIFDEANKHYQNEEFEKAIALYDSIENMGYISAAIHFNRGNSYYKLGNYPKSILYFEKAKLQGGSKDDINSNLELTNLQFVDKIEPLPELLFFKLWYKLLNTFNSKTWTTISIVFVWIFALFLTLFIFSKSPKQKKAVFVFTIFFFLASISVLYLTYKKYQFESSHNYAIIFSPTEYLKSAPDENSTDLFIVHEGLKTEILETLNSWCKIKLADGKTGWVRSNTLQRI